MDIVNEYIFNSAEIEEIASIIMCISNNMFMTPNVSIGKCGTYFTFGESITAAENTLKTIDFCWKKGHFADAFTLVRKYRDDLVQYIFISYIINNIQMLTEDESERIFQTGLDEDELVEMLYREYFIMVNGTRKSELEISVESWIYNELEKDEFYNQRKKYFDTSKYIKVLTENEKIRELKDTYLIDIWKKVDRILNNYVHTNGRQYVMKNYTNNGNNDDTKTILVETLRDVTSIFIAFLSMTEPIYLQSSDYRDAIDLDMTPQDGCQYWVLPIVVKYINQYFPIININLVDYIEKNNAYGMKFKIEHYEE